MSLTDRSRFELLGLLDDRCMDIMRDAHPEVVWALLDGSRHGLRSTEYAGVDDIALGCFDGTLFSMLQMLEPEIAWEGKRRKPWDYLHRPQEIPLLPPPHKGWLP